MKKVLLPILILLLLVSVGACSNSANETQSNTATPETNTEPASEPAAEPEPEPTPEPVEAIEFTVEGTYKLFAVMNDGFLVKSSDLEMESDITLETDGTGVFDFDGDTMDITTWTSNEDIVSITMADGGQANSKFHDGIMELDIYGDASMVMYYSQDGADISGYKYNTLEEVRAQNNGN